jgi:hypothetical protein
LLLDDHLDTCQDFCSPQVPLRSSKSTSRPETYTCNFPFAIPPNHSAVFNRFLPQNHSQTHSHSCIFLDRFTEMVSAAPRPQQTGDASEPRQFT